MAFYNKLIELCEKNHVKPSVVAEAVGLTKSSATYWKRGAEPKGDTLRKIAEYFGVSVDYLLGETDEKKSASTESVDTEADRLFEQVKQLSPEKQEQAFSYLRFLLSEQDNH
ncbi:MAG: helix-turn-helix transcriptional regulator [Clostridiales bacterium]|nr:helix-turn-helix transcriptional regulator [Clostridiales bacterium]